MISISEQDLRTEAEAQGYRPEILEKVHRLLGLLEGFMASPYLRERLVLKGGTAINLFCTNSLPRLSLDLDFNYIGSVDREVMLEEKSELKHILLDVCQRQGYVLYRNPGAHAGGKMVLVYSSVLGSKGRLELDLNFLYRTALWPIEWRKSAGWGRSVEVPVLEIHELAAGKLHALLERDAARDLFDSYQLLTQWELDEEKLRKTFTVYIAMGKASWTDIGVHMIGYDVGDIRNKLIPVLRRDAIPGTKHFDLQKWANDLVLGCQSAFQNILPFRDSERDFLDCLQTRGELRPELISSDVSFCEAVKQHPALRWRLQQSAK